MFVARRWCVPASSVRVDVHPLHGGLESTVALARIARNERQPPMPGRLVIKELAAGFEREAQVYELLWRHLVRPPLVRVLGRETTGGATYLYLEDAQPCSSWPWADASLAAEVCRELARFHESRGLPRTGFSWDYDADLARSAGATLELARVARDPGGRRCWRRVGDLRRVVTALPSIRRRLLSGTTTVIHGDVHPGNVILRRAGAGPRVVLIDWARARIGSPLEDIASWLHSLGCWEPQARRRHDTLIRAYLEARTIRRPFTSPVRADYWLASVSNGLSGAIRYHLAVLADPAAGVSARDHSRRALVAWERVVRLAAALVSTNPDR